MKYLNVILLLVVLGTTISLYYILVPSPHQTLFFVNLIFSCLLEILFFGAILKVGKTTLFTIPNLAVAAQITIYIVISIVLILSYNLYLNTYIISKWYFVLIALLSVFYLVKIGFTLQAAILQQQHADQISNLAAKKSQKLADFNSLKFSFRNSVNGNTDIPEVEQCSKALNLVIEKANTLPLVKLERSEVFVLQLNEMFQNLQSEINILSKKNEASIFSTQVKQVEESINSISNFITISKQSL